MLLNLHKLQWDPTLLNLCNVEKSWLPTIKPSLSDYGVVRQGVPLLKNVPICAVMGDQQASLFGHGCLRFGDTKNTFGTGCFILSYTAQNLTISRSLVSTVAFSSDESVQYAVEGPIASAGSAVNWLRDQLALFNDYEELEGAIEALYGKDPIELVQFVPALSGSLLCPQWNDRIKGAFLGLTLDSGRIEMMQAVLCAIAFSCRQVIYHPDFMCI